MRLKSLLLCLLSLLFAASSHAAWTSFSPTGDVWGFEGTYLQNGNSLGLGFGFWNEKDLGGGVSWATDIRALAFVGGENVTLSDIGTGGAGLVSVMLDFRFSPQPFFFFGFGLGPAFAQSLGTGSQESGSALASNLQAGLRLYITDYGYIPITYTFNVYLGAGDFISDIGALHAVRSGFAYSF